MNRFAAVVAVYLVACLLAAAVIVIRGDGPHPRVVGVYPVSGDRYWPGGTAQITFSQPMDQASVERALQVTPGSQGQGAWYGNTLNLQPVGDWKPGVTYHVELTGTVTDSEGRPLHTPVSFWFRVHHIQRLTLCTARGVRTVCEPEGAQDRPIFFPPRPVLQYALSPNGSMIAYTRLDASGLPHLFVVTVDDARSVQLTGGGGYADSSPRWPPGDNTSITYLRRPAVRQGGHVHLGTPHLWNIGVDGTANAPL